MSTHWYSSILDFTIYHITQPSIHFLQYNKHTKILFVFILSVLCHCREYWIRSCKSFEKNLIMYFTLSAYREVGNLTQATRTSKQVPPHNSLRNSVKIPWLSKLWKCTMDIWNVQLYNSMWLYKCKQVWVQGNISTLVLHSLYSKRTGEMCVLKRHRLSSSIKIQEEVTK